MNKELNLKWHIVTLEQYLAARIIPRSLRWEIIPEERGMNVKEDEEWANFFLTCGLELVSFIIKRKQKKLREVQEQIEKISSQLDPVKSLDEFNIISGNIQKFLEKKENELISKKQKKFKRDITDFKSGRAFKWQFKENNNGPAGEGTPKGNIKKAETLPTSIKHNMVPVKRSYDPQVRPNHFSKQLGHKQAPLWRRNDGDPQTERTVYPPFHVYQPPRPQRPQRPFPQRGNQGSNSKMSPPIDRSRYKTPPRKLQIVKQHPAENITVQKETGIDISNGQPNTPQGPSSFLGRSLKRHLHGPHQDEEGGGQEQVERSTPKKIKRK